MPATSLRGPAWGLRPPGVDREARALAGAPAHGGKGLGGGRWQAGRPRRAKRAPSALAWEGLPHCSPRAASAAEGTEAPRSASPGAPACAAAGRRTAPLPRARICSAFSGPFPCSRPRHSNVLRGAGRGAARHWPRRHSPMGVRAAHWPGAAVHQPAADCVRLG